MEIKEWADGKNEGFSIMGTDKEPKFIQLLKIGESAAKFNSAIKTTTKQSSNPKEEETDMTEEETGVTFNIQDYALNKKRG